MTPRPDTSPAAPGREGEGPAVLRPAACSAGVEARPGTQLAATMTEAELDRGVRAILRDLPQVIGYHTRDSRGSHSGFPDWVFAGPGGVIFRELKREKGRLTAAQKQWAATLTRAGADADVWWPADLLAGRIARELAVVAGFGAPHA